MTEDELLRFCYQLSSGHASSNAWRARIVRAWAWVASTPVQTIFSVLLTYYQINTSRSRSFPDYRPWAPQDETRTTAAHTNATGYVRLDVEDAKKAVNPLVEMLTNVNLMAFDISTPLAPTKPDLHYLRSPEFHRVNILDSCWGRR